MIRRPPKSPLFPSTPLFRSGDAAPLLVVVERALDDVAALVGDRVEGRWSATRRATASAMSDLVRSEEHTSELQSRQYLVCRLLLEKKKKKKYNIQCREKNRE